MRLDLDWAAIGRGAGVGFLALSAIAVLFAFVDRTFDDVGLLAFPLFVAALLAAGAVAARPAPVAPLRHGAAAGALAYLALLPVRIVLTAAVSDDPWTDAGQIAMLAALFVFFAASVGTLGAAVADHHRRRAYATRP